MIGQLREFCEKMRALGWKCEIISWENADEEGYQVNIEHEKTKQSDYIG